MAYTEYFSTDASAPSLSGTAGAFVNLLDKILSDGYGAKAPLGWAKEFTGTDKRVYRAATGTSRMRLRVDDTATATHARIVGYETMTDVDTGTNPWPTNLQISGGLYAKKSDSANGTVRPWYACGTEKWFMLLMFAQQTVFGNTSSTDGHIFFGECESLLPGDTYNSLIICRPTNGSNVDPLGKSDPRPNIASAGHYIPRSYAGGAGAVTVTKVVRGLQGGGISTVGGEGVPYPDPISGQIPIVRMDIYEVVTGGAARRLIMPPELRAPLMIRPGALFDTFSGQGALAGTSWRLVPVYNDTTLGRFAVKVA